MKKNTVREQLKVQKVYSRPLCHSPQFRVSVDVCVLLACMRRIFVLFTFRKLLMKIPFELLGNALGRRLMHVFIPFDLHVVCGNAIAAMHLQGSVNVKTSEIILSFRRIDRWR
jgi:hypothetical protein